MCYPEEVTRRQRIARMYAAERRFTDAITGAYWTFTRTARGKPPSMVVGWAYEARARIRAVREALIASRHGPRIVQPS